MVRVLLAGGSFSEFLYFGAPYAPGTVFYDNIDGFFQTAMTQTHNLSFSGATPDDKINYRLATSKDSRRASSRTRITTGSTSPERPRRRSRPG